MVTTHIPDPELRMARQHGPALWYMTRGAPICTLCTLVVRAELAPDGVDSRNECAPVRGVGVPMILNFHAPPI